MEEEGNRVVCFRLCNKKGEMKVFQTMTEKDEKMMSTAAWCAI